MSSWIEGQRRWGRGDRGGGGGVPRVFCRFQVEILRWCLVSGDVLHCSVLLLTSTLCYWVSVLNVCIFYFWTSKASILHWVPTIVRGQPSFLSFAWKPTVDQREIPLHYFYHWFQKPVICADSWFLESNGKKLQWDSSLIINRDPHGARLFVPTGLYFLLPVMCINLEDLAGKLFEWDDFSLVDLVSVWRHGNSESLIPESFMQRKQIVRGDFHSKNTS